MSNRRFRPLRAESLESRLNLSVNPLTVSGKVFLDVAGDSVFDSQTDITMSRWVVWNDQDTNTRRESSELVDRTNSAGEFTIQFAEPGTYFVRRAWKSEYGAATPIGAWVTLDGITPARLDFALSDRVPDTNDGQISGIVFEDLDEDGVRDPGESGLANRVVWADLNQNRRRDGGEPFARTDADGAFLLDGLDLRSYTVRIAGLPVRANPQYIHTNFNSFDATLTTTSPSYTDLEFGQRSRLIDGTGSVSGVVYSDVNQDGVYDQDGRITESGIRNRVVWVDFDRDGKRDSAEPFARTGFDGTYEISEVPIGEQVIAIAGRDDWQNTTAGRQTILVDGAISNVDFGQYSPTLSGSNVQGIWHLSNREFGEYIYNYYSCQSIGGPYFGESLFETGLSSHINPALGVDYTTRGTSEWSVSTDERGSLIKSRATGAYLGTFEAPHPYDTVRAFYTQTDQGLPDRFYWNVIENSDGSLTFQNVDRGTYLSINSDSFDFRILHLSDEIQSDSAWFPTDISRTIQGYVFSDMDGDGEMLNDFDPAMICPDGHFYINETPLAERIVWVDVDRDGVRDDEEPTSAITNGSGYYVIHDVPPGIHPVLASNLGDWAATVPVMIDSNDVHRSRYTNVGQFSPTESYYGGFGGWYLQNRASNEYVFSTEVTNANGETRIFVGMSDDRRIDPHEVDDWGDPDVWRGAIWDLEETAFGTRIRSRGSGAFLASDGNWDVYADETPTLLEDAYWGIILNDDGSLAFKNLSTGRYLDGDSDWVDLSAELRNDDGWFHTVEWF